MREIKKLKIVRLTFPTPKKVRKRKNKQKRKTTTRKQIKILISRKPKFKSDHSKQLNELFCGICKSFKSFKIFTKQLIQKAS